MKHYLLNEIHRVFPAVNCPNLELLLRSDGIDNFDILFLEDYVNRDWGVVDLSILDKEYSCISALSDLGLEFITPCFLSKIILGEIDEIGEWSPYFIPLLLKGGRGNLTFTPSQLKVIKEVALFLKTSIQASQ